MNFKQLVLMNLQALTNFPYIEKDFDAVTDYELLCLVVDHLNEVIKNSNEQNTVIQNLYNAFVALKDYVDNYFDNLDVQEEIDNKLDEMAKSGELADIIAQYLELAGVLAFNTLNDLKNAENITEGSICKTLGYNTYNDGKGYYYKIRKITVDDVVDNLNIIAITGSDTLIAERIFNIYVDLSNPIYYGADPTGTVDSSSAIQKCLDNNINKEITFTCGTYLIESPIEVSYNNQYGGINFNNSMLINNTLNDYVIGIGTKNHSLDHSNNNDTTNRFYNISNLKMQSNSTYAILIDRWFMNTRINNVDILTTKNGIQIGKTYDGYDNTPSDCQLSNFIITNTDMTNNYEAINVIGTDNKFMNGRIYGFKTGINANSNLVMMNDIHFLACNFKNENLNNDYVCIKNVSNLLCDMCYCDSYPCFVKVVNDHNSIEITNLFIYSWHNKFTESSIIDLSNMTTDHVLDVNYKNIQFLKSNYPNDTKFIELPNNAFVKNSLLNGFNSQGNIRIFGVTKLTDYYKDLSASKKGVYTNNYYYAFLKNWIPVGYLNIIDDGTVFINIYDNNLGLVTFKVLIESGSISSASKISQASTGYNPALGFKLKTSGVYEVCYAIDKSNLSLVTNTLVGVELISNPLSYITPIVLDLYKDNATPESSVDIVSSN